MDPRYASQEDISRRMNREQEPRRPVPRSQRNEMEQETQGRNRTVTIAVAVCSAVAVVAILIFLVLLLNGNLFGTDTKMTAAPNLVGKVYAELDRKAYPNIEITQGDRAFSNEYKEGLIMDQNPKPQTQIPVGSPVTVYVSMGPEQDELPSIAKLEGMTKDAAVNYLDALKGDLTAKFEEVFDDNVKEGLVVKTDPAEGTQLQRGQTVTVFLSKGPEIKKAKVPNVIGRNKDSAVQLLKNNGFETLRFETIESQEDKDTVVRLSVNANETIDVTTEIVVYLSEGVVRKRVPDLLNKTFEEAQRELNDLGFTKVTETREENSAEKGRVFRQSISSGVEIEVTTEIVLYVSDGPKETTAPPTTAPTTAATEPTRTVEVTIDLPTDKILPYKLTVIFEGKTIVNGKIITPGTSEYEFELTGSGVGKYNVYIDGVEYLEKLVDFNEG